MVDNIRDVAVVGAGISGVCTAAHLLRQGLSVTVYERGSIAGGVWHFDERISHEQNYPNETPSKGDYERIIFEDGDLYDTPPRTPPGELSPLDDKVRVYDSVEDELKDGAYVGIAHSSPGPCYVNLRNNVSLTAMKTTLGDWPAGLEEFVNQRYLEQYIQQIARDHEVHDNTQYNTRVEDIRKVGDKWRVCTTRLVLSQSDVFEPPDGTSSFFPRSRLQRNVGFFDAVVVASGHYNMPRIPNIPGLIEARQRYPDRISHSKGYRNAEKYRGANVLIIGAGVSSMDVAKEIISVGGTVYQSSRGGVYDLPPKMLPEGGHRVAGIEAFIFESSDGQGSVPTEAKVLPIDVRLVDGTTLKDIHFVILATGYITSYPFLADKHSDEKSCTEADDQILVTKEGDMVHNLYKDIFYIEDPTLSFVGVPYHISTFSLFDFQAQTVARVYSDKNSASIPDTQVMRAEYEERVSRIGVGRAFHSLRAEGAEIAYVKDLIELVNRDLRAGEEPMPGHTEAWHIAHRKQREALAERFGRAL